MREKFKEIDSRKKTLEIHKGSSGKYKKDVLLYMQYKYWYELVPTTSSVPPGIPLTSSFCCSTMLVLRTNPTTVVLVHVQVSHKSTSSQSVKTALFCFEKIIFHEI